MMGYSTTCRPFCARPTSAARLGKGLDQVKVKSVTAESASLKLGKAAKIHVMLTNDAESVQGVTVYF